MATFKDSTFRRSWGCLLLVFRVLADWLLFLNLLFNSAVLLVVTEQLMALDLSCEIIYFYYFFPFLAPPPPTAQSGARGNRTTRHSLATPLLFVQSFIKESKCRSRRPIGLVKRHFQDFCAA